MSPPNISRRQLLKGTAGAVSLAASAPALASLPIGSSAGEVAIGMATFQFRDYSNEQLARELAEQGVGVIQLFLSQTDSDYWRYNSRSDLSDLTPARSKRIAGIYRSAGISIHSIGVYTNLIHPDPAERQANLDYFKAMMDVGAQMDVRTFITEAGHYHDPKEPAPAVEYHLQQEVWKRMVETGHKLAELATACDATVLFEPFYRHFLASAKRTRVYLQEVNSPRLRALLDPANLLEFNDTPEMFAQLSGLIDCLHAKDRKLHVDRGVPAGQGDLDYHEFVRLAAEKTPHAPLILEYVGPDNYKQALSHLRTVVRDVGLKEKGR
jgi:sugar phosphate isomerase/epimerase